MYAKVHQAILELNYKPQRVRSKSIERSSWLIALIERVDDPFFHQMLSGIQEQANAAEYPLAIICVGETDQKRAEIFDQLRYEQVVGVIAAGVYMPEQAWCDYQETIQVPIVVLNTPINHLQIASVIVNFETTMYQAAQQPALNHRGYPAAAYQASHGDADR